MKISTEEVREGLHNGKIVWISHYNTRNPQRKPLRNITPTKCIISDNESCEVTKKQSHGYAKKNIYYSKSHFTPLGKNGTPLKKAISPVDNTGYRSYCGNMLNVFTTEEEAQDSYDKEYLSFHPKPTHISVEIKLIEDLVLALKDNQELYNKLNILLK